MYFLSVCFVIRMFLCSILSLCLVPSMTKGLGAWKPSSLQKLFYHDCLLAGKQQMIFGTLYFLQLWHWNGTESTNIYMFILFMPLVTIKEIKRSKKQLWKLFSLQNDFPRQRSPPVVGDNLDSCLSWSELKSKVWLSSLWFPSSIPSTILLRKIGVMEQFHKHHVHNYVVKITPKGHTFKQW